MKVQVESLNNNRDTLYGNLQLTNYFVPQSLPQLDID